jgi:hypothetical protein
MSGLQISIENSAGVQQGSGPIASAVGWVMTPNLDKLGNFSFQMPATDPKAALLVNRAVVRARDGGVEIGAGIVDKIEVSVRNDVPMLMISGGDLGQELTWRTIQRLELSKPGWIRPAAMWEQLILSGGGSGGNPTDMVNAYDRLTSDPIANNTATFYEYSQTGGADKKRVYVGGGEKFDSIAFTITDGANGSGVGSVYQYFKVEPGTADTWVDFAPTSDSTVVSGNSLRQSGTIVLGSLPYWATSQNGGASAYYVRLLSPDASYRKITGTLIYGKAPTETALAIIANNFPFGWSLDTVNGASATLKTDVFGLLQGENYIEALNKLAELTGEHWYIGTGRKVVWLAAVTPAVACGYRAVSGGDPSLVATNPSAGQIVSLKRTTDSYNMITRVYPIGAGIGDGNLTLANVTKAAPTGYTLDAANNYLKHTALDAVKNVNCTLLLKDIGPKTTDIRAREFAANQLLDAAYVHLVRRIVPAIAYELEVVGLPGPVYPGQTIRVVYSRWVANYHAVNIDADLIILSAPTTLSDKGVSTTGLTVSTVAMWPLSDADVLAKMLVNAQAMARYPQPSEVGQINSMDFVGRGVPITIGGGGLAPWRG